ncbi:MAG: hypothetical protein HOW73_34010 [Polyangiaceae bacterium]|nr:hypothetical protein [Polyangiaceae bacterium]
MVRANLAAALGIGVVAACSTPAPNEPQGETAMVVMSAELPATWTAQPAATGSASVRPVDTDGDGVPDERDVCPRERGADDENPAWAGCPYDAPPRPSRHGERDLIVDFGDVPHKLDANEETAMRQVARMVIDEPRLIVQTRAPVKATATAWQKLLVPQLVAAGIPEERIKTVVCLAKGKVKTLLVAKERACDVANFGD